MALYDGTDRIRLQRVKVVMSQVTMADVFAVTPTASSSSSQPAVAKCAHTGGYFEVFGAHEQGPSTFLVHSIAFALTVDAQVIFQSSSVEHLPLRLAMIALGCCHMVFPLLKNATVLGSLTPT